MAASPCERSPPPPNTHQLKCIRCEICRDPYILFCVCRAITKWLACPLETAPYDVRFHAFEYDRYGGTIRHGPEGRIVCSGENPPVHHDADFVPIGVAESSA